MRAIALICLSLLTFVDVATAQSSSEIRLRPGDQIRLVVGDEPELAGEYPIVESGAVLLPEIGTVSVGARAFGEVEREIHERYARILVDPEIQVVPLIRVAVLGEVREPGLFSVDPTQNFADVLALAGGLTPAGDPNGVSLIREGREIRSRLSVDSPGMAERFHSGDRIVVGRRGWARENLPTLMGAGASIVVAAVTALLLR